MIHNIAQILSLWPRKRDILLVGIVGLPGSGKSTLSQALCNEDCWGNRTAFSISIDDFYLPPEIRKQKGFTYRGLPGTHDTNRLEQFMTELLSNPTSLSVPVYDRAAETPLPERTIQGPFSVCIFEGWIVGSWVPEYEILAESLDILLWLDVNLTTSKQYRFEREKQQRNKGLGAMSEEELVAFWDTGVVPYYHNVLSKVRDHSDFIIKVGENRQLLGFYRRWVPGG